MCEGEYYATDIIQPLKKTLWLAMFILKKYFGPQSFFLSELIIIES